VEELTGKGKSVGKLLKIDLIEPNPDQPRKDLGDLSELTRSVKQKGVLEPILVKPVGERYRIIAGERRYRAALEAELTEIPCIEMKLKDHEVIEVSLIENLQRKDLHPCEEGDALKALARSFDYSHEQIGMLLSRSRASITESISIAEIPFDLRTACRSADISSKRLLLQIVRGGSPENMWEIFEQIVKGGATRESLKANRDKKKAGRPRNFSFKFQPKNKSFTLNMSFKKKDVDPNEIISSLEEIIEEIRRQAAEASQGDEDSPSQPSVTPQVGAGDTAMLS
jgi:ParB family chromosome partitioning protein